MNDVLSCLLSVAAALAVGCSGHVDLGGSPVDLGGPPSANAPDAVTDDRELAAQTTNLVKVSASLISSLAIDADFLYFISSPATLWRCQKSDCWATLTVLAIPDAAFPPWLRLNAGRLGWQRQSETGIEMCDAPDCKSHQVLGPKFEIWDEHFGYWLDVADYSIYRCKLSDCSAGGILLASLAPPPLSTSEIRDFALAGDQLYWVGGGEGVMRASVDGSTTAERLTLGSVTAWTTSRLGQQFAADVTVLDMTLDGPYTYAALRIGNQNANQTLACDTCKPGIAVARWQYSVAGAAREWLLMNDADVADLVHMRAFGGEVIWGTANGDLWSCVADHCSASKRQIGIEDASTSFPPPWWQFDSVAVDEQSIFWLSVPCQPIVQDCGGLSGSRDWTLKRTPRIPQ